MANLLVPPPELPAPRTGERMADIEGVTSKGHAIAEGLSLLEGFLVAFGAGPLTAKAKAEYETKGVQKLRFRIVAPARDSVDPFDLGAALVGKRLVEDNPWWSEDNRYYLTTAVARTSSIGVAAEDGSSLGIDVDIEALKIAGASSGFAVERAAENEVVYAGDRPLAFGVELCELSYDRKRASFRLKSAEHALRLRGRSSQPVEDPTLRAFIGGEHDDAFVTLT
jgi:hypothetical protein